MVITAWLEEESPGTFRLRVMSSTDLVAHPEHRFATTRPAEVLSYVRGWLADFADPRPHPTPLNSSGAPTEIR